ncbi:MAG: hypothetical protein HYT36_02960 [Candidatus Staskawiczbacteria bacterium]|nr:hypothetical protein [Candidatus Staskawiczbacteria bacterium]
MTNLLPEEEKKELLLKNKEKLIIILGTIVLVSLICLILILFSVKYYVMTGLIYQKSLLEQAEKNYKTQQFINFKDAILKYNGILVKIRLFYNEEIYFSETLKILSDIARPDGVYLTDIYLNRDDENKKIKMVAAGISDSRENLLVFKKNVEENKEIKNPYFSPESWTDSKDVKFHLNFELYKNENQE